MRRLAPYPLYRIVNSFVALAATTLVCEVPFLAEAFGFTPVSFVEYVIAMGIGMLGMVIVEIVKTFQRRAMRKRGEIL